MSELPCAHNDCVVTDLLDFGIIFFDSAKTSKTKYSGYCCFVVTPACAASFLATRALLTTECVAEAYNIRGWPCSGLDNFGRS
jgi:hypothetical protein